MYFLSAGVLFANFVRHSLSRLPMRRLALSLTAVFVLGVAAVSHAAEGAASSAPAAVSAEAPDSGASAFKQAGALFDTSAKTRPMQLSLFVGFPYGAYYYCAYYGCVPLNVGARFDISVAPNGFLPMLNDSFDLELGVDLDMFLGGYYSSFGVGLIPAVGVRWNFHLLPKLLVYAKVEGGVAIYPGRDTRRYGLIAPYIQPALGVSYNVTERVALRAEGGAYAIKVGLGINF